MESPMTQAPEYAFDVRCPRCGSTSVYKSHSETPPVMNCGDCLMDDIEIVALVATRRDEEEE